MKKKYYSVLSCHILFSLACFIYLILDAKQYLNISGLAYFSSSFFILAGVMTYRGTAPYLVDAFTTKAAIRFASISFLTILVFLVSYELYKPAYTYGEAQQLVEAEYSLAIRESHFRTIPILDTKDEFYRVAAGDEGQVQEFMVDPETGEIKSLKTND
ncbi:hypothetical protein MKY84_13470 [Chryseomicrobium sp. FSL W7-1435]|uniref:hypothetical protein n=1 Tax=Chryseomicrobium sp. FSL W7-1435 TaxID=2921704 RepID=UPI00315A1237